jgi:hypothetical protein
MVIKVISAQIVPITMIPVVVEDQLAKLVKDGLLAMIPMALNKTGIAVLGIQAIKEPATMALKITRVQLAANARGALSVRLAIV